MLFVLYTVASFLLSYIDPPSAILHCIIYYTQDSFGIDWNGPINSNSDDHVLVDPPHNPLSEEDYQQLCASVNPTDVSREHGVDLYLQCLSFVSEKLHMSST